MSGNYDNNKNPMPDKICIRNEDWSTSSISYDFFTKIYESMCKKEFMSQCKSLMTMYAGNHMFKIKVPDNMVYTEGYYTIRGAQHAVMFMHVLALASNKPIALLDKDLRTLVIVEVDESKGYQIHLDKDFIERSKYYGADDEVSQCLNINGGIYDLLSKYSPENYDGDFLVYGKRYSSKAVGFIYVINNAARVSLANNIRQVYIMDTSDKVVCSVKALDQEQISIESSERKLGVYTLKLLNELQSSSLKDIIIKLTTNIEYICDKLLDDKYDKTEAGVHISKLSQNIRSFV